MLKVAVEPEAMYRNDIQRSNKAGECQVKWQSLKESVQKHGERRKEQAVIGFQRTHIEAPHLPVSRSSDDWTARLWGKWRQTGEVGLVCSAVAQKSYLRCEQIDNCSVRAVCAAVRRWIYELLHSNFLDRPYSWTSVTPSVNKRWMLQNCLSGPSVGFHAHRSPSCVAFRFHLCTWHSPSGN